MVKGEHGVINQPCPPAPQPSHQYGGHVCLKNCHLVIDAVIAVTKGALQGLPAPEMHTVKHGSQTCLKERRTQDSRRSMNIGALGSISPAE